MKVPLSWLRAEVPALPPVERLAERLTMAGLEVASVIDRRRAFDQVVVGQVLEVKPHPNADKLRLVRVQLSPRGLSPEIVCGAPNVAVGQRVAVALVGARLPNGLTVERRTIRGTASDGMICSEAELGLGHDQTGILVLETDAPVGAPLATALGLDDVVLDVAIPSNRSDLLGVRGIAREVRTILGRTGRGQNLQLRQSGARVTKAIRVRVADRSVCPGYTARVIRGVTVRPSPAWVARRLRAAGLRPINNVVDATNLIMLEFGQPLHAFDLGTIRGGTILVRSAASGEQTTTLDGVRRTLDPSTVVIADAAGVIALAGVMGAQHTEISARTTEVVLESAIFDPVRIRRTSRSLGLVSEASLRFERGLPLELPAAASRAAAALIVELAGGQADGGLVQVGAAAPRPTVITIAPASFGEVLGRPVSPPRARTILTRFGCVVRGSARAWRVTVPWWRLDLRLPADLIEEVGRILGYADLPDELPPTAEPPAPIPELVMLKDELRDALVGLGCTETISYAYYGKSWADRIGGRHIEVANPIDASQHYLRKSLIPQLYGNLLQAVDSGADTAVFQLGRVFLPGDRPIESRQPWKIGIGLAFKTPKGYVRGRRIRGLVEAMLETVSSPSDGAALVMDGETLKGRTIEWCELDVATVRDRRRPRRFRPLPMQPAVRRDLSFWAPAGRRYGELSTSVRTAAGTLFESAELFDVYEVEERRSYAVRLTLRAPDRTLTESDISATMKAVERALRNLGAELR